METELYLPDRTLQDLYCHEALILLQKLISVPSYSRQEEMALNVITDYLDDRKISYNIHLNNLLVRNYFFDPAKKSILLNSHIDTVKPTDGYINDPFHPFIKEGKLYGLGSNDAGGALVSLLVTFLHFYKKKDLPFNLIFTATAEEEVSGSNGIESLLPQLLNVEFAIVGEPTNMALAIAERGLLVVDCIARGVSGHAAVEEGVNAIYEAMHDIEWIRTFSFEKKSDLLGPVKMTVTKIQAGDLHNSIPAECKFTIDIRVNDHYRNEDIVSELKKNMRSEIIPRSLRLGSSSVSIDHPFIQAGIRAGMKTYGSPTSSDQAVIPFPGVKLGPGDSRRSHTADEFIYVDDISEGIEKYISYLFSVFKSVKPLS